MSSTTTPRVAIVAGVRTPFVKAGTVFREHSALDLSVHTLNALLDRTAVDPQAIGELAWGIVVLDARVPHMAREINLRSRLPNTARALTLTDNCITGVSAIASVADSIRAGRCTAGIAGGVESMSNPSLLFSPAASRIFLDANWARSSRARIGKYLRLRPRHFAPRPPGIKEPSTGLSMGEHVELMVKEWEISRIEQDELALASHQHAHAAAEDGRLAKEIVPFAGVEQDNLIRGNTSIEKLTNLPPVFDRSDTGTATAGNSSPLTDGAAALLLMAEDAALAAGLEPLAYIADHEFSGIDPADGLLMGPAIAVPRLLARGGLELADCHLVEMHEAFGGQVACNLKAWQQGWKEPAIGELDRQRLNVQGSSIAIGHPFAATGIRIATSLALQLAARGEGRGLISICGAGATAAALLLER